MRAGHFLFFAPLLVACRGATEITVEVSLAAPVDEGADASD